MPPAPASSGGSKSWIVILVVVVVGFVMCSGIMVALLLPAINAARSAARSNVSKNNLSQLGLSLTSYRMAHGNRFPPAYVADASGKPLYSWRVELLPYMDRKDLYDRFDKTKASDSPENKPISDLVLDTFHNPSEQSSGTSLTDYVAVVGRDTVFMPPGKPVSNVTDGESNTIAIVEIRNSKIHWAEPDDLSFNSMSMNVNDPNKPSISSSAYMEANVLYVDGHVKTLRKETSPQTVRAMLTRNGGEKISPEFD